MKRLILIVGVLVCSLFLADGLYAEGFSYSKSGKNFSLTFDHTAECDSAGVWFAYPDTSNYYYRVTAFPSYAHSGDDSSHLVASGLSLDSIGNHIVKIYYFEHDGDAVLDGYASGAYFHDDDIATTTGEGAFACTVYAKLGADSSALPGIHVIAKNTDQTATLGNCYTNANGWCALGLDSIAGGAYHKFWLVDVDYSFTFPESADVNTDTAITFYGSAFDYGDPPAANQCAVYDQLFDIELDSLSGAKITVELLVPDDSIARYSGFPVSPYQKDTTTNVTGRWRFDLIPNADIQPAGTKYLFTFKYPLQGGRYFINKDTTEVPKQVSARYKDISGKM